MLLSESIPYFKSLPNDKILAYFKWKVFAEDNFKFDENGGKFSKR